MAVGLTLNLSSGAVLKISEIKREIIEEGDPEYPSAFIPHREDMTLSQDDFLERLRGSDDWKELHSELEQKASIKELSKLERGVTQITKDLGDKVSKDTLKETLGGFTPKTDFGSVQDRLTQAEVTLGTQAKENSEKFKRLGQGALTEEQREQLLRLSGSLPILRSSSGKIEGITLQQYIALGNEKGDITAYISGGNSGLQAVLKAGVSNFGSGDETEKVMINHNGTGHFGGFYFQNDSISFKKEDSKDPYLSIGSQEIDNIEYFVQSTRTDDYPINIDEQTINDNSDYVATYTFNAPGNNTKVTISIDYLSVEVYGNEQGNKLKLTLDNQAIGAWQGECESQGNFGTDYWGRLVYPKIVFTPRVVEKFSYTLYVQKGQHELKFEITERRGSALVKGLKLNRFFDAGLRQNYISPYGIRLFGSADRYFDIDTDKYKRNSNAPWSPSLGPIIFHNDFTAQVKGGLKVDRIEAEELDMPGGVLCGGAVKNGSVENSFGKYKNRYRSSEPAVKFNRDTCIYRVYHSIGHTKYVPMITMTQGAWNDLPHVVSIDNYSFDIKFINGNNVASPYAWDFNYVCYKGE